MSEGSDFDHLLQTILTKAMALCHADGGSFYLRTAEDGLMLVTAKNNFVNFDSGGTIGSLIPFAHQPLFVEGKPNRRSIAAYVAATGITVNLPDVYEDSTCDSSVIRKFDAEYKYRTTSVLAVPLKRNDGHVVGVLQFLNALDPGSNAIIPFDTGIQRLMESLSTLAATTLKACEREQDLRKEISELKIEIDEMKRDKEVQEIADSGFFSSVLSKVDEFRKGK